MDNQPASTPPPTPEQLAAEHQVNPHQLDQLRRSNKKKLVWGLICLIGPSVLLVVSLTAYAVINFMVNTNASAPAGDSLSADTNPIAVITNVMLFIVGSITVLTWLPGIIIGIILLASRKPVPSANL